MSKKRKMYDLVKSLLEENIEFRNDDKLLIWEVWRATGFISYNTFGMDYIDYISFHKAGSPESIRRVRATIQNKDCSWLRATKPVEKARQAIAEKYKGMHVYHQDERGNL